MTSYKSEGTGVYTPVPSLYLNHDTDIDLGADWERRRVTCCASPEKNHIEINDRDPASHAAEDELLFVPRGIADVQLEHEAVDLRFGERIHHLFGRVTLGFRT